MYTEAQKKTLEMISKIGIIPVIAIDDAAKAVPLAKALVAGGLPAAEVTFRTAAAEDAIKAIAAEVPEMLLGAGTVITDEQADRALAAGCTFLVSPGFIPELTQYVINKGGLMIPGTSTLGEMEQALRMGLEVLKFFPAEANGGVGFLKNCAGPHKNLKWMCTGGISAKNVNEYLGFNQITAVGGTWMFKGKDGSDLIKTENWDEITRLCREAVNTMLGFEVRHVGMNCATREEAAETAQLFSKLFGFPYKPGNSSDFSGIGVECNHYPKLGKLGHIAIGTNSVERAIYQLEAMGVEFNYDEYVARDKKNPDIIKAIYLKKEFSGFAVHLVQK